MIKSHSMSDPGSRISACLKGYNIPPEYVMSERLKAWFKEAIKNNTTNAIRPHEITRSDNTKAV